MRLFADLAIVLSVFCIFVVGAANADEAEALGKIEAVKAALAEGKGEAAAAAFEEFAGIVTADAAGAGEFAIEMADWQAETARRMARDANSGTVLTDTALAIALMRAEGFYGVLIPVGRGDMAAASKWFKERASTCSPDVSRRLSRAAAALDEAAGEQAKQEDALALAQVTVGAVLPLGKAAGLVEEKKSTLAGLWVAAATEYLKEEAKLAGEVGAADIADLALGMRAVRSDLAGGRLVEPAIITSLMDDSETTILDTYRLPSF